MPEYFRYMKKEDAIELRDKYREMIIGKPLDKDPKWEIKDVIICNSAKVGAVYQQMWEKDLTDEGALLLFPQSDDYSVFVISHQWPWGSGNLLFWDIEKYLRVNP